MNFPNGLIFLNRLNKQNLKKTLMHVFYTFHLQELEITDK